MKHLFLILSLILLLGIAPVVSGQSNAITVENAAQVVSLGRMGRGTPLALAWSPDGSTLAVGTSIGVWLYEGGDITTEPRFFETSTAVYAIAFSPDGSQLVSGGFRYLTSWEVASGEQRLMTEPVANDSLMAIVYSPDGSQIIGGSEDGVVVTMDAATGEVVTAAEGHTDEITQLVFNPDGSLLASSSLDRTVRIWSGATQTALLEGATGGLGGVAFSPDGQTLYAASSDPAVRQWDTATWTEAAVWQPENGSYVAAVALSPDGSTLMVGETNNKSIRFWDTASGTEKMLIEAHQWRVVDIALNPDGTTLASTGEDAWLNLIEVATGEMTTTSYDHTDAAWSVAFNPDATQVSVSYDHQNLRVWDVATQTVIHREEVAFRLGFTQNLDHNLFSPDGSKIATINAFNIEVFDSATWTKLYTTVEGASTILFSPDSSLLIAASGGTIYLYNAADGTLLAELTGHTRNITGLTLSADGSLLASASADGTVRLWGIQ